MTSDKQWTSALEQALALVRPTDGSARVAVLGIGQSLVADDAVGVLTARVLARSGQLTADWQVFETGPAPEAFTGVLRRFAPHLVVFVDAVDMHARPGQIAWFSDWSADGFPSTHGLPLSVLADYLRQELGCVVGLLGVQLSDLEFGESVSAPAQRAVRKIVTGMLKLAAANRPPIATSRATVRRHTSAK